MKDSYKKAIYYILLIFVFMLGVFVRTKVYGYRDYYQDDECRLLIAIMNKNYLQLFLPIGFAQSAPPIYLVLLKFWGNIFNQAEHFLKLIPYSFSILSMFVFYKLSVKCLTKKYSVIIANFLFCVNNLIIYFSSIIKQYTFDVFVCLLLTILFSNEKLYDAENKNLWKIFLLILFIPFISLPALFFVCAYLMICLIKNIKNKQYIKNFLLFFIPFILISFVYLYYNLLPSKVILDNWFPDYWVDGFINNFSGFITLIVLFLKTTFYPNVYTLFSLILLAIGTYYSIKDKNCVYRVIILSFVFAIIAAIFKIYPFTGRVALFFVPFIIILCTKSIDVYNGINSKFVLMLLCFLFSMCGYNNNYFTKIIINKDYYCNYSPKVLMVELIKNFNPKDETIIFNKASSSSYSYYSVKNGFYTNNVIELKSDNIKETLNSLTSNQKYWFYLIKDYRKTQVFPQIMEYLKTQKIIYKLDDKGSSLVLIAK